MCMFNIYQSKHFVQEPEQKLLATEYFIIVTRYGLPYVAVVNNKILFRQTVLPIC